MSKVADKPLSLHPTFCHIADVYDAMSLLISFGLIRSWRERAARYLSLGPGRNRAGVGHRYQQILLLLFCKPLILMPI